MVRSMTMTNRTGASLTRGDEVGGLELDVLREASLQG